MTPDPELEPRAPERGLSTNAAADLTVPIPPASSELATEDEDPAPLPRPTTRLAGAQERGLITVDQGYQYRPVRATDGESLPAGQQRPMIVALGVAIAVALVGLVFNLSWLGIVGSLVALLLSIQVIWDDLYAAFQELLSTRQQILAIALVGLTVALIGLVRFSPVGSWISAWTSQLDWNAVGALGEVFGAIGQILIAVIAVYVAWRQYVISKDLTIQQNLITQQQTIDSYFQGISELVLDSEGLLEDWPQERAIAAGRTAAILSSVDAGGKAKVIRFLSRSRLLSPLRRDRLLGRAILDGAGGYEEDRNFGVRVIDLGVMLAGANLTGTDLRWTDLSDANLIRANLGNCDLVKSNFSRTILCEANLAGADLQSARFFYGPAKTATPRSRTQPPNYVTGAYTGAVIEDADFTNAARMSEELRWYCCAWGGAKTRATIPGGCEGIPNLLDA
ncbi:MAG: pentapeptide repeat-containing protein [Cyanobacteria bacterium J069]|nr:MAG: pentapeptide repeat-containing protein [Cyanobacteria bacterium J069]